jgi:hypothetical protein
VSAWATTIVTFVVVIVATVVLTTIFRGFVLIITKVLQHRACARLHREGTKLSADSVEGVQPSAQQAPATGERLCSSPLNAAAQSRAQRGPALDVGAPTIASYASSLLLDLAAARRISALSAALAKVLEATASVTWWSHDKAVAFADAREVLSGHMVPKEDEVALRKLRELEEAMCR